MKTNPFLVSGYISPEYFCDRENESAKVISALTNDRNLTLIDCYGRKHKVTCECYKSKKIYYAEENSDVQTSLFDIETEQEEVLKRNFKFAVYSYVLGKTREKILDELKKI